MTNEKRYDKIYKSQICGTNGGIAQLARAIGSYPIGHGFKSSFRYHFGPLVKRLRHGPFTAVTWVRFPYGSPNKNKTNLSSSFSFLTAHTCRIEPIFLRSKKLWAIMLTHYWFYFSQSEKQYLDFRTVLSLLAFWDRVRKFDERTFRSHTSEPSRIQYKHSF